MEEKYTIPISEADRSFNLMFVQNRDELMLVLSLQGLGRKQILTRLDRMRRCKKQPCEPEADGRFTQSEN